MSADPALLVLIAAMAIVTAFTRVGGFWVVTRLQPGPRVRRFLEASPKTVFAAMIAPPLAAGGPAEWAGAVAAAAAMKLSGNLAAAIVAGVGVVALLRAIQ